MSDRAGGWSVGFSRQTVMEHGRGLSLVLNAESCLPAIFFFLLLHLLSLLSTVMII